MAGSYDEALSFSDKAIEIDPDCGEAYGAKGSALFYLGRFDESIETCKKAIELSPENIILCVQAYTNIGSSLSEKGMYEEALKNLDKALELPSKMLKPSLLPTQTKPMH